MRLDPGGGIRGDWYLGVARGSVSPKLGLNIINLLIHPDEDNRRFVRGVGLPVYAERTGPQHGIGAPLRAFKERMAWYRGQVPLATAIGIHESAVSRSSFDDYLKAREILAAVGEQLAFPVKNDKEAPADYLRRLKRIVEAQAWDVSSSWPPADSK